MIKKEFTGVDIENCPSAAVKFLEKFYEEINF